MSNGRLSTTPASYPPRILVVGMGNILRRDDGFGVEVAHRLLAQGRLPANVTVIEVGIGGISLVQELMAQPPYEVLIVVDAVQQEGSPGQVYLFEATVPDLDDLPEAVRRDFLADTHYATPERALMLSKALGILPARTMLIGCQPAQTDEVGIGLSEPVAVAVDAAIVRIQSVCNTMSASGDSQADEIILIDAAGENDEDSYYG